MSFFHIHKWTKWAEYEQKKIRIPDNGGKIVEFARQMQSRTCEKCGYTQRKEVKAY